MRDIFVNVNQKEYEKLKAYSEKENVSMAEVLRDYQEFRYTGLKPTFARGCGANRIRPLVSPAPLPSVKTGWLSLAHSFLSNRAIAG